MLIRLSEHMKPTRILSKPHKGIVLDNIDPLKLGRIKCTVEGLFEGTTEELPWITPKNIDPDRFHVPELEQELIIEFPYGDIYAPYYTGFWHSEANHNPYFDDDNPDTFGFDKQEFKGKYNKKTKIGEVVHPSGSRLDIIEDGTMTFNLTKDVTITVTGKYTKNVTGDILFNSDAKITLKSVGILTIDAGDKLDMKSAADTVIDAGDKLDMKSAADTKITSGGDIDGTATGTNKVNGALVHLNGSGSPCVSMNGHLGVVDLITGVPLVPSPTVFLDQ